MCIVPKSKRYGTQNYLKYWKNQIITVCHIFGSVWWGESLRTRRSRCIYGSKSRRWLLVSTEKYSLQCRLLRLFSLPWTRQVVQDERWPICLNEQKRPRRTAYERIKGRFWCRWQRWWWQIKSYRVVDRFKSHRRGSKLVSEILLLTASKRILAVLEFFLEYFRLRNILCFNLWKMKNLQFLKIFSVLKDYQSISRGHLLWTCSV